MPAGIPTAEAYEAILNVPNDADRVINILSKQSKLTVYLVF